MWPLWEYIMAAKNYELFVIHISVGRATSLWIEDRRDYFLLHSIQTASAVSSASCTMDKGRSFPRSKAVGARGLSLANHLHLLLGVGVSGVLHPLVQVSSRRVPVMQIYPFALLSPPVC